MKCRFVGREYELEALQSLTEKRMPNRCSRAAGTLR